MQIDKLGRYISSRELAAELRSMRWEFRFLLAAQSVIVLGLSIQTIPGLPQALASTLPYL